MRMFMLGGSVVPFLVLCACVEQPALLPDCQTTERSVALDEETAAGPAMELVAGLNSRTAPLEVTYQPRRDYLEGFTDSMTLRFDPSSAKWIEPGISGPMLPHCPTDEHLQVRGTLSIVSEKGLNIEHEAWLLADMPGITHAAVTFVPRSPDDPGDRSVDLLLADLPSGYAPYFQNLVCINGAVPEAVRVFFGSSLFGGSPNPIAVPLGVRHDVAIELNCGVSLYSGWTEPW